MDAFKENRGFALIQIFDEFAVLSADHDKREEPNSIEKRFVSRIIKNLFAILFQSGLPGPVSFKHVEIDLHTRFRKGLQFVKYVDCPSEIRRKRHVKAHYVK